jgi:hypothetical protein
MTPQTLLQSSSVELPGPITLPNLCVSPSSLQDEPAARYRHQESVGVFSNEGSQRAAPRRRVSYNRPLTPLPPRDQFYGTFDTPTWARDLPEEPTITWRLTPNLEESSLFDDAQFTNATRVPSTSTSTSQNGLEEASSQNYGYDYDFMNNPAFILDP